MDTVGINCKSEALAQCVSKQGQFSKLVSAVQKSNNLDGRIIIRSNTVIITVCALHRLVGILFQHSTISFAMPSGVFSGISSRAPRSTHFFNTSRLCAPANGTALEAISQSTIPRLYISACFVYFARISNNSGAIHPNVPPVRLCSFFGIMVDSEVVSCLRRDSPKSHNFNTSSLSSSSTFELFRSRCRILRLSGLSYLHSPTMQIRQPTCNIATQSISQSPWQLAPTMQQLM